MSTAANPAAVLAPELNLADIQGIILRSYRMPFLRTIALRVDDPAGARAFLGTLAGGGHPLLRIQDSQTWDEKPQSCLNVAFTADGLKALGLPDATLQTFPAEFVAGAVARAGFIGDTGVNDPANWMPPFNSNSVHILLIASTLTAETLAELTTAIHQAVAGAATQLSSLDGVMPKDHRAHFGFVDGISQPRVAGVPKQKPDGSGIPDFGDPMTLVAPGAFVLGHESPHPGHFYEKPSPDALGDNGSFAALRVLQQDCAAFERFLDAASQQSGVDRELIAAKICGRWRSGVPLALSPDSPNPANVPVDQWNEFNYADDPAGKRCPLGSHIRRNNPRSTPVAGDGGERHRIMRRGLPYGPPHNPANPDDGIERGLLGLFICGNLRDQFEFLMKEWVNDGDFAGLGLDRDPILGNQPATGGRFRFPNTGKPQTILRNMSTFITTRAGAYCFLPSLTALRYLANLS